MALAFAGVLVLATPVAAQIVNGNNGANGSPEAPIGTKAGGSDASMQAPGEADAAAGAAQNTRDEKNMSMAPGASQDSTRTRTARTDRNNPNNMNTSSSSNSSNSSNNSGNTDR